MDVPYRDAGRFSDASQLNFLLHHHSWIYPYRDSSQFSDASQRIFFYYVTLAKSLATGHVLISNQKRTVRNCVPRNEWCDN